MTIEKTSASSIKATTGSNSQSDPITNATKKKKRRRQKKKNSPLLPAPSSSSIKKRNRSHKSNNGAPSPLVHLPHAKVTLRHIGDPEKYGKYSNMIDLIKRLVEDVNASAPLTRSANALSLGRGGETFVLPEELSTIPIILEKSSIDRIQLIEKSINTKEALNKIEEETQKEDNQDIVPNETNKKSATKSVTSNEQLDMQQNAPSAEVKDTVKPDTFESSGGKNLSTGEGTDNNAQTDVDAKSKEPEKEIYKNEISARVLYMVPPRKSRRRGVITGHAYIVLHPPMPRFIVEKTKAKETKLVPDSGKNNGQASTFITAADRTKALAQSRLILRQAIYNLTECCKANFGKDHYLGGMKVEMSLSQKIWKFDPFPSGNSNANGKKGHGYSGHYHAKYDSTIEQSEDFQAFLAKKTKIEEDIANRPKPPPGGGTTEAIVIVEGSEATGKPTEDGKSSWSSIVQETMENGQPIPALVLHLRQKKAAAQKLKATKSASSSALDSKSKKSSSGIGKGKGSSSSGRGQSTADKKAGKGGGKKAMIGSSKSEGGSKKGSSSSSSAKKKQGEKAPKKGYSGGSKKQNGSQGKYKASERNSASVTVSAPAKILMKPSGSGGSNIKK